jgi:RNA-binding protein
VTELVGKDKRALRAMGHHLRPIVQVGQQGITPAVVEATEEALAAHELVKVKILEGCPLGRFEAGRLLAEETRAELVQVLGRTCLLYKQADQKKPAGPRKR